METLISRPAAEPELWTDHNVLTTAVRNTPPPPAGPSGGTAGPAVGQQAGVAGQHHRTFSQLGVADAGRTVRRHPRHAGCCRKSTGTACGSATTTCCRTRPT
ncbi:hypothetical protein GCM10010199_72860 [Dactylosporangium roseum]